MNCPNFNIEAVRDEFNRLVITAGGEPLTIEEFKNKDLRNKRSGVDDLAMQVAYRKYDNNTNPLDLGTIDKDQVISNIQTKSGVSELFESNTELANIGTPEQYSQYLDTIFPDSKVKDIVYHGTDEDISEGFDTSKKSKTSGSNSPHMVGHVYTSFQRHSTLPYITGIGTKYKNIKFITQYFEVKELFKKLNKAFEDDISWQSKPIKELLPNKDKVKEYAIKYGLSDTIVFTELLEKVYDVNINESFNTWRKEKSEVFKNVQYKGKNSFPIIVNLKNPLSGKANDTRYFNELQQAEKNNNDGLIMYDNNDAFNSDVVVVFKPEEIHILGSRQDIEGFKKFVKSSREANLREQLALELANEVYEAVGLDTNTIEKNIENTVTESLKEKIFRLGEVPFEKTEFEDINVHVKKRNDNEFSIVVDNKGRNIFGLVSAVLDFQRRDLDSDSIYSPNPKGFILWETFLNSEVSSTSKAKVIVDNRFSIALGALKALKNNGIEYIHFPERFAKDFKKEYSQFLMQDFSSVGFTDVTDSMLKTVQFSIDDLISIISLKSNNQEAVITPNDKIVFGHPGIGKTYLRESGRTDIIDFDSDYKIRINEKFNLPTGFKARNDFQKSNKEEYQKEVRELWIEAKQEAKSTGKQLFASDMILLREFANDFDKVITMSKDTFVNRAKQRNDYTEGETENWKNSLDTEISKIDKSKVINTNKYLSNLLITPQQKQQAQQLYSQYLSQNPNGNIEQFKNWIGNNQSNVQYQLPQGREMEEFVASEKTIRDLAARMSSRIGIPVRFESDRSKKYKGKLEELLGEVSAFVNLAYATLDTPIHEILGHPIIRAIKNSRNANLYKEYDYSKSGWFVYGIEKEPIWVAFEKEADDLIDSVPTKNINSQLYQNLLKELEYGKGKEVLDRIKRDYITKKEFSGGELNDNIRFVSGKYYFITDTDFKTPYDNLYAISDAYSEKNKYNLEEQQEEAIVELLGLYTAQRLDNVKDGKLISLLKRLLKEMKSFVRSLLNQKEVEIDKLPDNMTLGDIADLLAYSNSKLILPGNEVIYTTPDNQQFKTYAEASNHISQLAKIIEDVDLSDISLERKLSQEDLRKIEELESQKKEKEDYFGSKKYQQDKELELSKLNKELEELKNKKVEFYSQEPHLDLEDKEKYGFQDFDYIRVESTYGRGNEYHKDILGENYEGYYIHGYNTSTGKPKKKILPITKEQAIGIWEKDEYSKYEVGDRQEIYRTEGSIKSLQEDIKIKYEISSIGQEIRNIKYGQNTIQNFIDRNKEYEQSKEIIEEWKRVNNIQYNPDEVYSRGQEFVSVVGAYSNFDVNLMMQNLLQHIEDNQKAGGEFVISAFTKPSDRIIPHLEGGGGRIKFKIYPKSQDIKWAANSDVYSGSVWDASEKVSKDKKSELLGVSYTKYPSLEGAYSVQPNLAYIIDNLSYHHNELGISLTGGNFRLEYSDDIPHSTKKIIDSINSILDQKYGKVIKPDITTKYKWNVYAETSDEGDVMYRDPNKGFVASFDTEKEAQQFANSQSMSGMYYVKRGRSVGVKPTQTNETLKESISDTRNKLGLTQNKEYSGYGEFSIGDIVTVKGYEGKYKIYELEATEGEIGVPIVEAFFNLDPLENEFDPETNPNGLHPLFNVPENALERYKDPNKKEKEYTSQAIINTKIAKLKEVAKKYPRSLIRSEVRPINGVSTEHMFDEEVLPFQKLSDSNTDVNATDEILLDKSTPPGVNNESGILPLEPNRELYKSLGLIDKNGASIKVWSYKVWGSNPSKILERVLSKKNSRSDIQDRYEFILRNHPNGLGYSIWLRAKEVDPLTKGQISMFQREAITNNVISGSKKSFSFNALLNSTKKTIVSIANEMSNRFGIAFSIISQDELAALEAKYNVKLSNSRGFYIHQERKAYLVEGKFNESTAIHEIFGHPFLEMLKSSPELWHIYNNLATEAFKKYSKVSAISALYSDKSDRTQTDELIIRLLTDEIESRSTDKGIASAIRAYTKAFFRFVKSVFNKNTSYTNINMKISISSLADYVMYGKGEINLLSTQDKSDYAETVNKILSTFGKPNSKSRVTSLASINEAIAVHGGDFSSMIDGYKNDAGIPNMRFLNIGLKSMANTVEDGIVYDSSNKKIGEYTMSDGVLTIISGNEKDVILSILNHESNQNTKISILSNNIDSLYLHMLNCLPHQCFVIQSNNGVESIVYNKEVRDMYSPVLDVDFERISGDTIHDNNVAAFISTISDGLKAQLHMLERKPSTSKEYLDKIKKLIDDIDTYGEVDVILKFIDHAEKEVNKVVKQINIATEQMTLGEQVDKVMLNDMRRNFITLYKSAFDSIARINSNYAGIMSTIPAAHKAATDAKIDAISKSLMYIESSFYNIQKYAYGNLLIEEGEEKRGSNTIRDRFKREANGRVLDDFYVDRRDVGLLHTVLGNALFSGSEQVRILDRIVSDVNSEVNRAMETDGVIVNLYRAWKEVRSKNKLATFSSIMEHDENGKATGYISHRLKYGKFNAEYNKFMATLKEKYGIAEFDSLPENDDDKRNFILEKEEWLSRNVERTYTPEYYKLRKSLSPSVTEVLDESEDRIRSFTSKFRGGNGKLDTRMMTEKDKNDLFYLQKEKQCLSMFIFPDGTPKMEGTEEYKMAVELQDFYSKLYKNVQFKPNFDAFNEAMEIARESMTESQFNTWLKDNTKVHIEQSFYDSLSSADTEYQTDDWNRMYNIRKNLLKLYRDPNSMEVSANRIKESDSTYERDLLATIKRIDIYLNENRVKSDTKSNFGDIAEIVPTEEYQIMLDYLVEHINDEGGQAAYDAWHKEAHYIDSKGRLNRYSYYNKMEPIDKSLITRVPSGIWSEIDEASPYFNKKYDRSLEKYGMQPSEALYDNSKAFRAIESKPEVLAFRDALEAAYEAANSHYSYISRPNNLRLAQIPGGFMHKVAHGSSGIISGLREALSDEFHYREYDDVLGDYSSKDKFYADGSPVMVVPTRFRKMLDNPDQISRNLLSSFAMYYKAALNFSKMNEKTPDIELLLEGIKNTSVINDKERITAGRTNMYQKALEYVNSEVYGRDLANDYELAYRQFNPFKWIYNKISKKPIDGTKPTRPEDRYNKISLSKPIRNRLTSLIRIVNLSKNVKAAFSNFSSAAVHLKIEASCGIFTTNKTYALAKLEVTRRMPEALASIFNRSDDKLISMMRYFGIGRSNEADMKNLHGSRLGRALAEQFWYGEYSAGDFAIKSQMMVSVLMNIKPYKDESGKYRFYQREQFASKFYKGDRLAGLQAFDTISDNLYGAMEVVDGVLGIKEKYNTGEYEGSISNDTLNYAAGILGTLARTLDGSLTGVERSRVHKDIFGSMLLLHRNYLLWAVQERFHGEMFRYDKGMMATGMYRGKTLKVFPAIAFKVIMSKLTQIATLNKVKDVTGYNSKYSTSDIANSKRMLGEYAAFLVLATGAILMAKSIGDDDDKRKESLDMWAYILLLRTTLEVGSLSSPIELWNLQKNPSAAQSFFQAAKDLYDMHSDGTYNSTIKSGIYKNKTKRFRALTKMTPIWKNIYPSFVEPDLRNDERFIKSNVGSTYDLLDHIIYPENPRRKEDKEKNKKKKTGKTIVL